MRSCYEVLLKPHDPPRPAPGLSIPPSVVHGVAKHGCRLRMVAGYRGEFDPGVLRIRDDLAQEEQPDDRDRCKRWGCVRFVLRDGEPECAQCGAGAADEGETMESALEGFSR